MLAAWAASPARFREDANAEEDAALGAYRDRLVVELVQNAVDAATAAGVPARVLLRLTAAGSADAPHGRLEVANNGAPLTAAGVEAAATLRASAKRDAGSVGRFGVGFAAVLAVSDAPVLASGAAGAGWSRQRTAELVGAVPALADELGRRGGSVPVLRLPFATAAAVPAGYDTVVRLPLRDAAAYALAERLLDELDPTLPLVLPGLAEICTEIHPADGGVEHRLTSCTRDGDDAVLDGRRWLGATGTGVLEPALLADRPVEERERRAYEIRAFVPADGRWPAGSARVLRAPQPTDEPLSLPVLLSVPLPLDPSRRHSAPGPLRDHLLDRAAETVADLAERVAAGTEDPGPVLGLVPTGLPAGEADGRLRAALIRLLPGRALLPGGRPGRDGLVPDIGAAAAAFTRVLHASHGPETLPGLLPPAWAAPGFTAALEVLGAERLSTAGLVDLLAGISRPPSWWAHVYAALADVPDRDALGALPVPLADGRTVTGARGVLLPADDLDVAALTAAGLPVRVVDPAAATGRARDVLRLLGAVEGTARGVLGDPAVLAAVSDGDPDVWPAILALVRDAGLAPGEDPRLAELLLPAAEGSPAAAGDLLLPGGPLAAVVADGTPFGTLDPKVADSWPAEVLAAVGVVRTFGVLRADPDEPVLADPDEPLLLELDDSDTWVDELADAAGPRVLAGFAAVRDLELVDRTRWPVALTELGRPPLREIVLGPEPSYTRWWLGRHALLPSVGGGLLPPGELLVAADPLLDGLYAPVAAMPGVDDDLLRAIGVRGGLADVLADPDDAYDLLDRVGNADRETPWRVARVLYLRVAARADAARAAGEPGWDDLEPPLTVRTADGVHPAADAVVVDAPDLLPLLAGRPMLRVPLGTVAGVARLLDLERASDAGAFEIQGSGEAAIAPDGTPYRLHAPLRVRDLDGVAQRVGWRVVLGTAHVDRDAGADALGRALAWRAGRWSDRHALVAALRDPAGGNLRQAEEELD